MPSKAYPHPEERPTGASRRTQDRAAALHLNSCPASALHPPYALALRLAHDEDAAAATPPLRLQTRLCPTSITLQPLGAGARSSDRHSPAAQREDRPRRRSHPPEEW